MRVIEISKEQAKEGETFYSFKKLKGSIQEGEGNIYGALGEIVIRDLYISKGFTVDCNSTYDYDLIIEGHKVDVKAKRSTTKPRPNHLCSIPNFNTHQKCDFYFFVRVNEKLKECFLLGYMRKEDFFAQATFNKKGELDIHSDRKGWRFKEDCWNVKVEALKPFKC